MTAGRTILILLSTTVVPGPGPHCHTYSIHCNGLRRWPRKLANEGNESWWSPPKCKNQETGFMNRTSLSLVEHKQTFISPGICFTVLHWVIDTMIDHWSLDHWIIDHWPLTGPLVVDHCHQLGVKSHRIELQHVKMSMWLNCMCFLSAQTLVTHVLFIGKNISHSHHRASVHQASHHTNKHHR